MSEHTTKNENGTQIFLFSLCESLCVLCESLCNFYFQEFT